MNKLITVALALFLISNPLPGQQRKVLVELFTNAHCPLCPPAHSTLESFIQNDANASRVDFIYYHMIYPYSDDPLYLADPTDSDTRDLFYGPFFGTPDMFIDGRVQGGNYSGWAAAIDSRVAVQSALSISLSSPKGNGSFTVTAVTRALAPVTASDLVLHFVVIEDVNYQGRNGVTPQMFAMRKMLPDADGKPLAIDSGMVDTTTQTITLNPAWIPENLSVVVFVQSTSTKEVYQSETIAFNPNAHINPDTAQVASIDRFSAQAGHLFVRDGTNGLPGPNVPVDFDKEPFLTKGLGPAGEGVSYYNFDVQPTTPAPIYVLFKEGESSPVTGQLNIVNAIPGDSDYSDFWEVQKVTVPADYYANTVTSYQEIVDSGYSVEAMGTLVNCPIVPDSSTATLRLDGESPSLHRGWYRGEIVYYFTFSEKALMATLSGMVPLSPIYVSFNINPDAPGGGPSSGFKTDSTGRTHNVVATLPADSTYSPLWAVSMYDNADFRMVRDLTSAQAADILVPHAADVNCPVVELSPVLAVESANSVLPGEYSLYQNYPNPFNPKTIISYELPATSSVSLKIYNILGQEVTTLFEGVRQAGKYDARFDGSKLASGVYFYRLEANHFVSMKKMLLLK
jgi:hypothetical protein